jgi:hypothetical protein
MEKKKAVTAPVHSSAGKLNIQKVQKNWEYYGHLLYSLFAPEQKNLKKKFEKKSKSQTKPAKHWGV